MLQPALKRFVKSKEVAIAAGIKTVNQLKAFFFNPNRLSRHEV